MLKTVYGGVVYPSFYDFKNNITSAELKGTTMRYCDMFELSMISLENSFNSRELVKLKKNFKG